MEETDSAKVEREKSSPTGFFRSFAPSNNLSHTQPLLLVPLSTTF